MKAKSYRDFKKNIASEVGVHPDLVDEFITFYYAKLRRHLSDLTYPNITVTGLGTFQIRKPALNKAIKKNKSILGNLSKDTYNGYEKHLGVSEKLEKFEAMIVMIKDNDNDKAIFKEKKDEYKKANKRI